jgi:acetolactate synthase-1/3 small subunit
MAEKKHTLVALVADKPGVLNRMASLFRRRGFNIESIAVGHSELPHLSRMTAAMVEQVRKQLDKLVDVVKVTDISAGSITSRELALIKVRATSATRSEIIEIADIFRASIVDVASDSLTIEITGDEDKLDSLLNLLRGFGIREIARTGRVAMVRGSAGQLQAEERTMSAHGRRRKALQGHEKMVEG